MYTKVMPCTADFHDEIAETLLAEAEHVMGNATTLDAAFDVLDTHAPAGNAPIRRCLRTR
jgi:hypothetical protein